MQILQELEEVLKFLVIYLYQNFYFPLGTLPIPSETIFGFILILIAILPITIPLLYYSSKLQGFVKYSEMWKPWKKLALGYVSIIIGVVMGISALIIIYLTGIFNQYVYVILFALLLSPMLVFILISVIMSIVGIRQFYQNAKKVVEHPSSRSQ
ncbi:MAG: hypothetical protein ACFFDN_42595 [Candidatus Hodarchaeota archaeon]